MSTIALTTVEAGHNDRLISCPSRIEDVQVRGSFAQRELKPPAPYRNLRIPARDLLPLSFSSSNRTARTSICQGALGQTGGRCRPD